MQKDLSIKAKKVVQKGIKCYEILSFSCYNGDANELPIQYYKEFPYCFEEDGQFVIVTNDKNLPKCECGEAFHFGVGDFIDKEDFERAVEIIRVCGEKLHNINQQIKVMKQEWNGEVEIKI